MRRIQEEFKKWMLVLPMIAFGGPAFGQAVVGEISRVGDATHLEFKGRKNWNYDINRDEKGFLSITVPAFDEVTEVNLRTWVGPHLEQVSIDKNGPDKRYVVKFKLRNDEVEAFDYLTDDPSRLILDFYKQPKLVKEDSKPEKTDDVKNTLPEKKSSKKVVSKSKRKNKFGSQYKKVDRSPAGGELISDSDESQDFTPGKDQYPRRGIFDASDPNYDRFRLKDYEIKEEAIIASEQNIYLKFPVLEMPLTRFEEIFKDRPEYQINEKDSKQNEEARLLLTLYQRERYGAFMKVYSYYVDKYKDTPYDEIVFNLAAEMHAERYLETKDPVDLERFRSILKMLNVRFKKSPLFERNELLLAYSALFAGQAAEALQLLERYERKNPKSKELDHIRLAIAEAYTLLKKPNDATRVLASLEKDHLDRVRGVEAAYRLGDVSIRFQKYKEAQKRYNRALDTYPEFKKIFPNAAHNIAEAEFWTKDYQKSLNSFIEYLRIYPNHDHGGYALTRIGELLEILGADRRQVMGAFIEGYFRYPKNPGSDVARVRMLSQGLKGMKEKERDLALKEISDIRDRSPLDRMDEFTALMSAEGLSKRGEYRNAMERLLGYFQNNPTKANKKVFRGRILRNISNVLKKETEDGGFLEALNFYDKYQTTWLKNHDRIDVNYYKSLAYEQAGVLDEALDGYQDVLKRIKNIKSKKELKERKVYEHLPEKDSVALRIASVAYEQKNYRQAYRNLASIKTDLSEEEEVEKVRIGADVAMATGDKAAAISYLKKLIKNWEGSPELLIEPHYKLAQLYLDMKRYEECGEAIAFIEEKKSTGAEFREDLWADTLELKAEYQIARGQKLAAVQTYVSLLDGFESKRPIDSIRYKAGLILFEEGDIKGAEKLWSGLQEEPSDFYKRLAKEKLSQLEWDESYKKYLKRIPAAQ